MSAMLRLWAVSGTIILAAVVAFAAQQARQPSLSFGAANIPLGITIEQAQQILTGAGQHFQFLPNEQPPLRTLLIDAGTADDGGQITFSGGRAVFVEYQMPIAQNADALAQEIAGAVESMETKTCSISNYSGHGTGGGYSQSAFQCGTKRFNVMTTQTLGSNRRDVNVSIAIGQIPTP